MDSCCSLNKTEGRKKRPYKQSYELYTEIIDPITVNIYQIQLSRKCKTLLSDAAVILYKAG